MQALIADDANVNFAAGNVLLGDGVRLGLAMDELNALGKLFVVVDDRSAGYADRAFFAD